MSWIFFLPFIIWQLNFGILTSVLKPVTPNIIQDTLPRAVNSKRVLHKLLAVDLNWGDFCFLSGWWWFHYISNGARCCLFQRWWQVQFISHSSQPCWQLWRWQTRKDNTQSVSKWDKKIKDFCHISAHAHTPPHVLCQALLCGDLKSSSNFIDWTYARRSFCKRQRAWKRKWKIHLEKVTNELNSFLLHELTSV